jgi:Fic family protein
MELILDVESMRGALNSPALGGETIKSIQEWVKIENSIRSNKIEGNQTTYVEMEEALHSGKFPKDEFKRYRILETTNHYKAEEFIDDFFKREKGPAFLSENLVRESHSILLKEIPEKAEGVPNPGEYRKKNVRIVGSEHVPPHHLEVPALMASLMDYCRQAKKVEFLVSSAIAHHRFAWIHPFGNGNGRAARLFTYAMLKYGGFHFNGMVSLPRAFERDKQDYYGYLAKADAGDVVSWVKYFLRTLLVELGYWQTRLAGKKLEESIDGFLDSLLAQKKIIKNEKKCLKIAFMVGVVTNDFLQKQLGLSRATATRILTRLADKKFLENIGKKKGYKLLIGPKSPLIRFFIPD